MTDQPEDKRGEASEQTRARAQMEEWMNVWQSSVDPIDELREDFLARTNKTRTLNLVGIVFLMLCGLMLIINAILRPEPFTITVAVMCVPFVTYISARLYKWQQLYRRAPPMTPASYLATMRLHLEVKRAQHRWDQRFWPVSVIGPAVGFDPHRLRLVCRVDRVPRRRACLLLGALGVFLQLPPKARRGSSAPRRARARPGVVTCELEAHRFSSKCFLRRSATGSISAGSS